MHINSTLMHAANSAFLSEGPPPQPPVPMVLDYVVCGRNFSDHHNFAPDNSLNYGWVSACINSISCILFCFVYFKLCHVMFTKTKSRNWITISLFGLIIVALLVGCISITTVVMNPRVYQLRSRNDVTAASLVFLAL